jgi:rhodanese-related sulfurtransferase
MRTLTAKQLKEQRKQDENLLLINVLETDDYEQEHIPDSDSVPVSRDDFIQQVQNLAGRKDRHIVVHCSSKDCKSSPKAANKLIEAGFTNVADFEGGMAEWKLAGFETESGAPAHASS